MNQRRKPGPDPAFPYKRRLGAWMFMLYALVYAGFVVINLVQPRRDGRQSCSAG